MLFFIYFFPTCLFIIIVMLLFYTITITHWRWCWCRSTILILHHPILDLTNQTGKRTTNIVIMRYINQTLMHVVVLLTLFIIFKFFFFYSSDLLILLFQFGQVRITVTLDQPFFVSLFFTIMTITTMITIIIIMMILMISHPIIQHCRNKTLMVTSTTHCWLVRFWFETPPSRSR